MFVLRILKKLRAGHFDRAEHLLRIEINEDSLRHNISEVKRKFPNYNIAAVLKSNAYGHGLIEVGQILEKNSDVSHFAVDSIVEARQLRSHGIQKPCIILGYVPKKLLRTLKKLKDITLVVNSFKQTQILLKEINSPLPVHIKVDIGMHRQGTCIEELEEVMKILSQNKYINIRGLLSHLADADSENAKPTLEQLDKWDEVVTIFKRHVKNRIFHFSNTAGLKYVDKAESNLIRFGIGLYGFNVGNVPGINLKPILSYYAKIVNIKELKKGESIGYNFTFTADKDMRIAIIPCGYYEGVPLALSNKGSMYFKGVPLSIIGKVSMNLTIVDITNVGEENFLPQLEDEIEVFSTNPSRHNSIQNVARICDTITYDILVRFPTTIRRVIV